MLSQSVRPNQFAILPGPVTLNVAPYDPSIFRRLDAAAGPFGLPGGRYPASPAGIYTLLPARYALLPGAFLVSAVSGYQDIQSGQTFPVRGGGTIIAGYRDGSAGTTLLTAPHMASTSCRPRSCCSRRNTRLHRREPVLC